MKTYAIGVDIGGTTVKTGIFEKNGKVIDHWEIPTRTENNGVNILPDITDAIMKKLNFYHISRNDIEGLGIGVPGPVDNEGTVLGCVNLGWDVFNIEKAMSSLTGFQVKAGNDANIAALSIVNEVGRLLGKTLAGIACVVAPQAFVIGGGMSKAGDILISVIEMYFRKYAFHAHKDIQFRLAELGNLAGIYGAAKLILE